MTDSNPIARLKKFRDERQEASKKFRENQRKRGEQIKQTTASKVIRGALSGPLKAVNETVEFVDDIYDFAVGNPYDNNELIDLQALGLEIKGDKEDWTYTMPQAITQFLLPAGVISKGLKGTKLVGMNNAWARNAVAGFITDAVVQDPYEENLFNMIDKHPRLATPISELLKAKTAEEIGVAEARFRQASGGLVAGEALTALGLGVKAIKKTPELYERVIKRLSRRDEILMTDNVVDNLGDEIIDDLAFTQNLFISEDELEEVLKVVQDFDPPGVGALNLKDCLIIQLRRKKRNKNVDLAIEIIENSFEQFSKKHFEKLMSKYSIDELQLKEVITLISKLNPKPGGSYAGGGKPIEQVIPDFKISIENAPITSIGENSSRGSDIHIIIDIPIITSIS